MTNGTLRTGFAAAAATFVAVFAAGATPIPLYERYRLEDGLTTTDLSVVAACYFVAAVTGLLVLGRLSDHLGRRPVALAAIGSAILGSVVLCFVDGPAPLLLGRILQGLAAGLASSAVAAFAVDTAPDRPRWLLSTLTSAATNVGLTLGSFGAGFLVQFGPWPGQLSYLAAAGLLSICAVGIVLAPESTERRPGALRSLRPRFRLPAAVRPSVPAAASLFLATWAFGGYFQAFGPVVAVDYLHSDSPLVAAAVFASWMAPSVVGGTLAARLRPVVAQRLGAGAVVLAAGGLVSAISIGSATVFITAGCLGGMGMGAGLAGSMALLLPATPQADRAGLLALVYATSYLGAAIPSLIAGHLAASVSLLTITIGYAVLAALALLVVLATSRPAAAP